MLNYITELPEEILELKNLKILDLTENPSFSDIGMVSQLTWLQEFYCYGCRITPDEPEQLIVLLPNCKIGI